MSIWLAQFLGAIPAEPNRILSGMVNLCIAMAVYYNYPPHNVH